MQKLSWDAIFINIATAFPGGIHHLRVLRHTALYQRANNDEILLESKVNLNGTQMDPMFLRDVINPMSNWLLKPNVFSPTLSAQEKNFSKNLSSARATVESLFVILKVRQRE